MLTAKYQIKKLIKSGLDVPQELVERAKLETRLYKAKQRLSKKTPHIIPWKWDS